MVFLFKKGEGKGEVYFMVVVNSLFHTCFAYLVLLRLVGQYDLIGFLLYVIYEDPEGDLLGHGFPVNHVR